jgi:hypothetical protein
MLNKILIIALLGYLTQQQLPNYDPDLAMDTYYYSKAAYCTDWEGLKNWKCEACKRHPGVIDVRLMYEQKEEAFGFCAYDTV